MPSWWPCAIGPWHRSRTSRARFRDFLHHEVQRGRNGAVDLPVDHRCPWGPVVGRGQRTSRRRISVHLARLASGYPATALPQKRDELPTLHSTLVGSQRRCRKTTNSHTHRIGLLHCNAPTSAMAVMDCSRQPSHRGSPATASTALFLPLQRSASSIPPQITRRILAAPAFLHT